MKMDKTDNVNNLEHTNRYVQGSVWKWANNSDRRAGVQSGGRPVLIISNNTFNYHSPVVNCVSITSALKESPVHVPLYITMDSHIQCEQIHTIPKSELTEFTGMVSNSIMSSVKAKLRIQFDMGADRYAESFDTIKRNLAELNSKIDSQVLSDINANLQTLLDKAEAGFGIPALEDDIVKMLINFGDGFKKLEDTIAAGHSHSSEDLSALSDLKTERESVEPEAGSTASATKRGRGRRRKYTDEDVLFITNKANSIDALMERFEFKDRQTASRMRTYFKKK